MHLTTKLSNWWPLVFLDMGQMGRHKTATEYNKTWTVSLFCFAVRSTMMWNTPGVPFTKYTNRKWLRKWFKGLEKFCISSCNFWKTIVISEKMSKFHRSGTWNHNSLVWNLNTLVFIVAELSIFIIVVCKSVYTICNLLMESPMQWNLAIEWSDISQKLSLPSIK